VQDNFEQFMQRVAEISEPGELRQYFVTVMNARGFDIISYQYGTRKFKKLPVTQGVRIARLPGEWVKTYIEAGQSDFDPIQQEAMRRGAPFTWADVVARNDLTPSQKTFMDGLRAIGITNGMALPVFARPGDMAHFCLASTNPDTDISGRNLLEYQAFCQRMHVRFNELLDGNPESLLSGRETQVLELIAAGKSNAAISAELEISTNTVDTLVRRCFEKLSVTSRVEAVLAGVSQGVIIA
jgi:DNA-binding CsgD family transcriptional regulator